MILLTIMSRLSFSCADTAGDVKRQIVLQVVLCRIQQAAIDIIYGFLEPFQVALVYDPVRARAGYFFWEGAQRIDPGQASWREFDIAFTDATPQTRVEGQGA